MDGTMVRVGGWRSHGAILGRNEMGFQGERKVREAGYGACSSKQVVGLFDVQSDIRDHLKGVDDIFQHKM